MRIKDSIEVETATNTVTTSIGVSLSINPGAAATPTSAGGNVTITGGAGGSTSGNAGNVTVQGGTPTSGAGGSVTITGANAVGGNNDGGNIVLTAGAKTGSGTDGIIDASATTSALKLPTGTTAQRFTATDGLLRYNSDEDIYEGSVGYPAGSFATYAGLQQSLMYRKRQWFRDDFCSGNNPSNTTTATLGELGWSLTSSGTSSGSLQSVGTDHPGVYRLQTGTTSGNNHRMHISNAAASGIWAMNQVEYFAYLIRIPTITTLQVRFGLGQDISSTTFGTDGVFFQFDPSVNSALQFVTRAGSTSATAVNTVTVAGNTWYLCEAFYDGTTWTPRVNGTNYNGQTTNIPTGAGSTGAFVQTATTAARNLDVDWFALCTRELGARY